MEGEGAGRSLLRPGSGLGLVQSMSGCVAELPVELLAIAILPDTVCSGSWAPVIEPEASSILTNWPCSTTQVITKEQAEMFSLVLSPRQDTQLLPSGMDVQESVQNAPSRR